MFEDLELSLSARIAAMSENNIEMNQLMKDSMDGLIERVEKLEMNSLFQQNVLKAVRDDLTLHVYKTNQKLDE
jgi:hypothetical protein